MMPDIKFHRLKKKVSHGHSRKGSHDCLVLKEIYEDDHIKCVTLRISRNELCNKQ
jgi:hypothetical protein